MRTEIIEHLSQIKNVQISYSIHPTVFATDNIRLACLELLLLVYFLLDLLFKVFSISNSLPYENFIFLEYKNNLA